MCILKILKILKILNFQVTAKIPLCIGIFDTESTLYIGCDNEDECDAWFRAILDVYASTKSEPFNETIRSLYGNFWTIFYLKTICVINNTYFQRKTYFNFFVHF